MITRQEQVSLLPYNTFGMDVKADWREVLAEMNAGDNPYDGYDPLPFNDPSKKYFTVQ